MSRQKVLFQLNSYAIIPLFDKIVNTVNISAIVTFDQRTAKSLCNLPKASYFRLIFRVLFLTNTL